MTHQVPRSIELLRQQARDELSAIIEHRCRAGEDPWQFIPDLPSVDEQVVIALRASAISPCATTSWPARRSSSPSSRTCRSSR